MSPCISRDHVKVALSFKINSFPPQKVSIHIL